MQISREIDTRHLLPALVIHLPADASIPVEAGRELAAGVPGAKYPGTDHWPFYDRGVADRIIDEVEEFLTESRHEAEPDRALATVLFRHCRLDQARRRDRRPRLARAPRSTR